MLTFVIQHSCLKEQGVLRNNLKKNSQENSSNGVQSNFESGTYHFTYLKKTQKLWFLEWGRTKIEYWDILNEEDSKHQW